MRVYLDHNATTPLASLCRQAMAPWLEAGVCANASSVHGPGRAAREAVDNAREQVAQSINAAPKEVIFTSGATEANNLAVRGIPGHVVVTAGEHPSTLETAQTLGAATVVPLETQGTVSPQRVLAAFTPDTRLCSVIWANNETGAINDVASIAAQCRDRGVLCHVDAAQALGKIPVDVAAVGCDLVTFSSHKVYGPQGAGALWVRRGVKLNTLITGGHQERGRRAGTENTAAIVGFGAACTRVPELLADMPRVSALRDRLWDTLRTIDDVKMNGEPQKCLPNTLNVRFAGLDGETLLMALDLAAVSVSVGSACTAGSLEPSHVLLAMGIVPADARCSVRFSLGVGTQDTDIEFVALALRQIISRIRRAA